MINNNDKLMIIKLEIREFIFYKSSFFNTIKLCKYKIKKIIRKLGDVKKWIISY